MSVIGREKRRRNGPNAQGDHSARGPSRRRRTTFSGKVLPGCNPWTRQHDCKMRARCAPASDHRHLVQRVDQVRHQAAAGGVADVAVVCSRRCFTEEFFVALQVLELQGQGSLTGFGMLASSFVMRLVFQLRIRAFRSRGLRYLAFLLLLGRGLRRLLTVCRRGGDGLRLLAAFRRRAGIPLCFRVACR